MDVDVLYDGFGDDVDLAVIAVEGAEGSLRAQAFARGNPVPVLLVEEGLPEKLAELVGFEEAGERRLAIVVSPSLGTPVDVEVLDDVEVAKPETVILGKTRLDGIVLPEPENREESAHFIVREFAIETLRKAPCLVWDHSVLPAGDSHVLRFKVTLRTDDPVKAGVLAHERLMFRVLDSVGRKVAWPITILEDSTARREGGAWHRDVVVSVTAPDPLDACCLWVWSRVIDAGGFRGFPKWFAEALERDSLATMASVARDSGYDAWVKGQRDPEAADRVAAPGRRLSVLVVDEPEVPLAGTGSAVDRRWSWLPWVVDQTRRPSKDELRAITAASLRAQTLREFDVRFVEAGAPFGHQPALSEGVPDSRWTVIVGLGDELEPDALETIAAAIDEADGALAVYADEDVAYRDGGGVVYGNARLKPAFSADELYFGDGVGLPLAVAPEVMDPEARSVYELALGALEKGGEAAFHHVEAVLLHAPWDRPFATGGMVPALAAHLERRGIPADVVYRETNFEVDPSAVAARHPGGVLRVRYGRPDPAPLVSVIIPNRDHADYLGPCVRSILELTRYPNYEVVIVENGSREEATLRLYEELQAADPRVRVVGWRGDGFNYPAIVNRGVEKSSGDLVCLLNNDTVVLDGDWMDELAGPLMRPEIGITGALLSFEDGLVQHAGMMAVPDGGLAHQQQNLWPGTIEHGDTDGDEGYLMTLQRPVAYTMVTGACQMVRRSLYEELGGYDEALAVGYNDADFCLRAAKVGRRSLFTPYARLTHKEFGTRHREIADDAERERWLAERRLMMERHPEVFGRDPFLNRALDPDSRYFSLERVRWPFETESYLGWPIEED